MRVICPACGLSSLVSPDKSDGEMHCARCGKRIRWSSDTEAGEPEVDFEDDIGIEIPIPAVELLPRLQSSRARGGPGRMVFAGLVGAVTALVLVVLAMVVGRAISPASGVSQVAAEPASEIPWDRAHRSELLAAKGKADDLALAGQWQEAYDAYKRVIATVADHEVNDAVVVQLLAGARTGQDRVMGILLAPGLPAAAGSAANVNAAPVVPNAPTIASSAATQMSLMPVSGPDVEPYRAPASNPTTAVAAPKVDLAQLDPAQLAADTAPALPGPPPPRPNLHAYTLADAVTDEQIGESIANGVSYLKGQFRNGEITGLPPAKPPAAHAPVKPPARKPPTNLDDASDLGDAPAPVPPPISPGPAGGSRNFSPPYESAFSLPGVDALCVYALLHAGQAMDKQSMGPDDPFVDQILSVLKQYNMIFTYHRSLRAAALAVLNRAPDNAALEEDVRWLLAAGEDGAYSYSYDNPMGGINGSWDNSNSQYGLLGVWSGAMAGKAVPADYWRNVEKHWDSCALADGTFPYTAGAESSPTMTCAGVASLLVARDYLEAPDTVGAAGNKLSESPAIDNGLKWLDSGDNCMLVRSTMGGAGYGLYGLERVGLASGFKYFGSHDWYLELAKRLVNEQHLDGSWGAGPGLNGMVAPQTLIDTSYALLFLARGRHPILFNKLRYDVDWNDRPHDVAHLARYSGKVLERPLNWQVVNLRRNWFDWMDSPVLYISGDKRPNFSPADYDALRAYANGGGLIFTHADGGSPEFTRWVIEMTRTIYPQYELMQVPRNHPIYSTVFPMKDPPPLLSISNESRILVVHSPTDLAGGWQLDWTDEKKAAFRLGVNLFVYAAGKGNLKNRLASTYIPEDPNLPESVRQIARLQYAAEWDPEPYAWARFRRFFQWETHRGIEPVTVQLKELKAGSFPMATLTGTVRHDFTEAEQQAARAYVAAGGVLLIDACGGDPDFVKCVQRTLLPQAFDGVSPLPIGPNHPLLLPSRPFADDLSHLIIRGYASEHGGKDLPILTISYGKGWVIFSRLDITTGLLGTQSWGISGYEPAYAQALMKNAVLWAEARSSVVEAAAPAP